MLVAQFLSRSGSFSFNFNQFNEILERLKNRKVDLIFFPSHFITGLGFNEYQPSLYAKDKFNSFLSQSIDKTRNIEASILVGTDLFNHRTGNYILHVRKGEVLHVFSENANFDHELLRKDRIFSTTGGRKVLVSFYREMIQSLIPLSLLNEVDMCVVFMDEPFYQDCIEERLRVLDNYRNCTDIVAINSLGLSGEKLYDGSVLFLGKENNSPVFSPLFEENLIDLHDLSSPQIKPTTVENVYRALLFGIKEFSELNGKRHYVLGLSGGIDSAVVATLAVKAVGADQVKALILPSEFTSTASLEDARILARNLQIEHEVISIQEVYKVFRSQRGIHTSDPSLADENLQARLRMLFLMYEANRENRLMLNTSNKSEILTGYGTLYGDAAGALSVLGDLYKMNVYNLAKFINQQDQIIPERILTKEPSAELRQNQKDSDALPPYPVLDPILIDVVENELDFESLLNKHDSTSVKRVLKLLYASIFKSYQLPPKLILQKSSLKTNKKIFYPGSDLF